MQVFKAYFKVIKRNLPSMSIYLAVFALLSVLMTASAPKTNITGFSETKTNIAFFNNDEKSPLTDSFEKYLSQNARIIKLEDNKQVLQDALFFGKVEYIVRVPKGFEKSFLSGDNTVTLDKTTVPSSTSAIFMDFLVNKYFNTARLYTKSIPGIASAELVANVEKDLKLKSTVTMNSYGGKSGNQIVNFYFNYLAYSIMAILILGITSIMLVFNQTDLRRRNLGSPVKIVNMNLQLISGSIIFSIIVWAVMIAVSFVICGNAMFGRNSTLFILNALILTIVCLSISYFIGNFMKSRGAQQAVANVLSLGMCFISGVFVPQYLLGSAVKTFASFTPIYWYVKANNDINNLVTFSTANMMPIVYSMLVELGFAATMLALSLVVARQKRLAA